MSPIDVIDLSSDEDAGEVDVKPVKMEPGLFMISMKQKEYCKTDKSKRRKFRSNYARQELEENRSPSALSTGQSGSSVLDQEQSPVDDASLCSTSPICSAPLIRQFWKAGSYEDVLTPKSTPQNGSSYLQIHPKFLHSNATSHKWAFGAIAELLDNAVDEIQNGATFVVVDKTLNPRNGSSALLIKDDGGGMDPEAMRRCLSFGFSNKKSKSAIGQYGNGFKTSSMRLGADAIVFSRNRKSSQSIGLLSYTFLTQTWHDRIVVPMIDYEFNASTGTSNALHWHNKETFSTNLSILLQWSPYSTEKDLLKQFDDIGHHGTKVIIYNLWFNDEGTMELDFESDLEDILITGGAKSIEQGGSRMAVSDQHIANRLRYSLRAYLSVLYLRIPESFSILLRGRVVELHNIATDLKFPEFILYKPQSGGCVEGTVITTIGFLKEAPDVNIHGFNVYHKNRLILPFWRVVSYSSSRGRGVVGVLEANFIEPTHNKQDFEKTSIFQKLEGRLKEMTFEYWDCHCGLIGYQVTKKPKPAVCSHRPISSAGGSFHPPPAPPYKPVQLPQNIERSSKEGAYAERKGYDHLKAPEKLKRRAITVDTGPTIIENRPNQEIQLVTPTANLLENQEAINLMKENEKLHAECLEYQKREEELNLKVNRLRAELREAQSEYARLLGESHSLEKIKNEKTVR
ncbi:hypothetical protein LguiA_009473 [Lonicera macranthoides]